MFFSATYLFILLIVPNTFGLQYLGCYDDYLQQFDYGPIIMDDLTPSICLQFCSELNLPYVILKEGDECYCVKNRIEGFQQYELACDYPCSGDINQICGGVYKFNLYYNNTESPVHNQWETLLPRGSVNSNRSPQSRSGTATAGSLDYLFVFGGFTFYKYDYDYYNISGNYTFDYLNSTDYQYNYTSNLNLFNDLWKFDLKNSIWTLLHNGSSADSPSPRMFSSLVYDMNSGNNRLILYGGFTRLTALGTLYSYDLYTNKWTNIFINGNIPTPRGSHTALLYNSLMYVHAGADELKYYNDFWTLDLDRYVWSEITPKSENLPDPRSDHSMIRIDDRLIISFGRGTNYQGNCYTSRPYRDIWSYSIIGNEWTVLSDGSTPWDRLNHYWTGPLPSKRFGHVMMPINGDNSFIIFGGIQDYLPLNDLWRFDIDTRVWELVTVPGQVTPYNRTGATAIAGANSMYIFGGEYSLNLYFNDIWVWQYNSSQFSEIDGTRGVAGKNNGIAFGAIWAFIAILLIIIYFPHKRKIYKTYSVKRQNIQDQEIFSSQISLHKSEKSEINIEMSDRSPFDTIPDEIITNILSYIDGVEMARISQVSQRFHQLANDHLYWKQLCLQYWTDFPDKEISKNFFINRFTFYKQKTQEARIYRIFAILRSTIFYYVLLFAFSSQIYILGLKLDNYISVSWFSVFFPLWVINIFLLLFAIFIISGWLHLSQVEFRGAISRTFPFLLSRVKSAAMLSCLICNIIFSVLLCVKLDEIAYISKISWWVVFAPLLYIFALVSIAPLYSLARSGWTWSNFWSLFLGISYDITLIIVVLRLENEINSDWCLVFLPWWISDVFALVTSVSLCMELKSAKLGWCLTFIYTGYLASIVTFRSLICVNLGSSCSDPIGYSWNLIFISLQVLVFIFGVPVVIFLRHKF